MVGIVRASPGQRHDVIRLRQGPRGSAPQAPVAVPSTKLFELLGREATGAGVPRGPPLAAVVGLEALDLRGVVPAPPVAASDYALAVLFIA